jgi:hypothetical protein
MPWAARASTSPSISATESSASADEAHDHGGAQELGPPCGQAQGDEPAHRVADEGARREVERLDQRGGVLGLGVHVELLARRPGALALAAQVVADDAVPVGEGRRLPGEHPPSKNIDG